jgi:hypothetical protein
LRAAKQRLQEEYTQAFVPQSLPDALSLLLEYSLFWWDPLQFFTREAEAADVQGARAWGPTKPISGTQLEAFPWFEDLATFTELLGGDDDPDRDLVPQLVQRSVFPEVRRRLEHCWDVTSARESTAAAGLLDECLLFELDPKAGAFAEILKAAFQRLQDGLADYAPEVFVEERVLSKWYGSAARSRLLWRSCKIARCALMLEGRLPDAQLSELVLTGIFTTRIAPHLRAPRLDSEEMRVIERFVAALPERWFLRGLPAALVPLRDALGPRAPAGPAAATTAEAAAAVLERLHCYDEAQVILGTQRR